jgi:hypothetical protein
MSVKKLRTVTHYEDWEGEDGYKLHVYPYCNPDLDSKTVKHVLSDKWSRVTCIGCRMKNREKQK